MRPQHPFGGLRIASKVAICLPAALEGGHKNHIGEDLNEEFRGYVVRG